MNQFFLSSSPVDWRRCRVAIFALAVVLTVNVVFVAPRAFAETKPPIFLHIDLQQEAYSTRVMIEGQLEDGGLDTEWRAEYSTSCKGPWTEVDKESVIGNKFSDEFRIGMSENEEFIDGGLHTWFRHLTPDTSYCARFTAKNADGEATPELVPFKTLPVAKPEVGKKTSFEFADNGPPRFTGGWSDTGADFKAEIEGNGAETQYGFEYAPAELGGGRPAEAGVAWKPFTVGATGTITVAEEHAVVEASLAGLVPETTYYVRLRMHNSAGEMVQTKYIIITGEQESFRTPTERPVVVTKPEFRNVTATSAHVNFGVGADGSETRWRFEYATSAIGPWSVVPGGEGVISQAQVKAKPYAAVFNVGARLTGLSTATTYYVRLFAENAVGEGKFCYGELRARKEERECEYVSVADRVSEGFPGTFETAGPPSVTTFAAHGLVGEALQLDGGVDPKGRLTSGEQTITVEGSPTGGTFTLTFEGQTTVPIAYNAQAGEGEGPGSVGAALSAVTGGEIEVEGRGGGPYTVAFVGSHGGVSEPAIEANGSGLTPSGKVTVSTLFRGGESTETHYRFEYVNQVSFAEGGWSDAEMTPEASAAPSSELEVVHALLPVLPAGETYHYRTVATTNIPGVGLIEGQEQTLRVPSFSVEHVSSSCPNEAFRTGLSAHLPDCRAYELLTPIDKEGSQEVYKYGVQLEANFSVGEDGGHALLAAPPVSWGFGPGTGNSPFLFSRGAGSGWGMTAGSPQPQTGIATVYPQMYSGDLSVMAFQSRYEPSGFSNSPSIEYKIGPVGGPYTTVASVPREGIASSQSDEGWVASNAAFSKLVLQTRDHRLLGGPTGTRSGSDLYEYTPEGGLRQLNVMGEPAVTIGSCGARVVRGQEDGGGSDLTGPLSSLHTVSVDGSRVFFYASAPHECASNEELETGKSPRVNLYVRMNGSETFDIGPYRFLGANEQGTRILLEDSSGEVKGYNSETGTLEPEPSGEKALASELALLGIPDKTEPKGGEAFFHPRYTYWSPGHTGEHTSNGQGESTEDGQVYRYDSVERVVECVSCASSYDPHPTQQAFLGSGAGERPHSPFPLMTFTSADGRFAFFTTPSALIPRDVDGEIPVHEGDEYVDVAGRTSPSSDVYEWRATGVDGCDLVQGCVSLITDGRGGYLNILLGSADEGREVFVYTRSKLLPQDVDSAGDVYAVRVDGGFAPPPPRPTECEGGACSIPPPPPNDATPSSLTFNGIGNSLPAPSGKPVVKSKKPHKARKPKKGRHKGRKAKHGRVAGRVVGVHDMRGGSGSGRGGR